MTPKVTEIIQSAIQNKPFAYGTGFGEVAGAAKQTGATAMDLQKMWLSPGGATPTGRVGGAVASIVNALKFLAFIPK